MAVTRDFFVSGRKDVKSLINTRYTKSNTYLSILVGKISTVFLQILEYLLTIKVLNHHHRVDIFGFQS